MDTLTLDVDSWDIGLDESGDVSVSSNTRGLLQDACSAAQTWLGEVLYDLDLGISYTELLLSGESDFSFYMTEIEQAVAQVPGVALVTCHLLAPTKERRLIGLLALTLTDGHTHYVTF